MTFRLSNRVLRRLTALSRQEQRAPENLIEEALQGYLDSAAADGLSPEDVGQTQLALVPELGGIEAWTQEEQSRDR